VQSVCSRRQAGTGGWPPPSRYLNQPVSMQANAEYISQSWRCGISLQTASIKPLAALHF
jgi:hypothetical protein